jgi:hypothetical protein
MTIPCNGSGGNFHFRLAKSLRFYVLFSSAEWEKEKEQEYEERQKRKVKKEKVSTDIIKTQHERLKCS